MWAGYNLEETVISCKNDLEEMTFSGKRIPNPGADMMPLLYIEDSICGVLFFLRGKEELKWQTSKQEM